MTQYVPPSPVPYSDSVESISPGEDIVARAMSAQMRTVAETQYRVTGRASRNVHAEGQGLLRGHLEVPANLPPVLAQGLFSKPGRYPVVMRLSTSAGIAVDGHVIAPHGLAVKVLGVEGERLADSEHERVQDFVLANAPTFERTSVGATLQNALPGIDLQAAVDALLWPHEALEQDHILGETFFSQVPLRFGQYIAKIAVIPVSHELMALEPIPTETSMRSAVARYFSEHSAAWDICVQLCTDLQTMPIEDASKPWSEAQSPFIPVGRLVAPKQGTWTDALSHAVEDELAFSPWRGLAAHRPLGAIMRMRKNAYAEAAAFREKHAVGADAVAAWPAVKTRQSSTA